LHGNCLLKRIIEGKIEGRINVTERQGRRRKQLPYDLKRNRIYCELKKEALVPSSWRAAFEEAKDLFNTDFGMNVYPYTTLHHGGPFISLASSNTFSCTALPEV
jgi:hypothetical protein